MATEERQRVKFTGDRTGMEAISVPGIGLVEKGDTIELLADEAEAYTAELPMADGKTGSDFKAVGEVYKVDLDEEAAKQQAEAEKAAKAGPQPGTAEGDAAIAAQKAAASVEASNKAAGVKPAAETKPEATSETKPASETKSG